MFKSYFSFKVQYHQIFRVEITGDMTENKQVVEHFYSCFQKLDWKGMQDCYGGDVIFYDPVFQNLDGDEVRAMWKMLCLQARDLRIEYSSITLDEDYGTCKWEARYTFSKTGRKVHNRVKAHFKFSNGKIVEHMDAFDIYRWSRQALGIKGFLFGWASAFKNTISRNARAGLKRFMEREKEAINK